MKRKMSYIIILLLLCLLPISAKAINIANVKSSTNHGFNEGGDYYYLNWEGIGDKTFSDKYIVYDLGNKYTLTLTIKSAYVNLITWSSKEDLNNSCKRDLGKGYSSANLPCSSITGKDKGRLIAINKNSISIHMWGIKQLNVEYELKYDNKSMSEDDIKERIGEINVKLIDVDNQQAIRIDSGYSNISNDNNILKGCRYDSVPKYQDPYDKKYYKYFNKQNCDEKQVSKNRFQSNETDTTNKRGWIKFKSSKSKIKLAFFSGQKTWYSFYQKKYKYGHAYFKFVTGNIETTPDKTLTIEKKAYESDGTQYSSGSIPKFSFKVQKLKNDGKTVLKERTIQTSNDGKASLKLSGDWKCAENKCKYRVMENRTKIKNIWAYWHYPSKKWSDEVGVDDTIWPEITYQYTGNDLTFTFKNKKKESEKGCNADLKKLVNGKGTFNDTTKEATFTTINSKVLYDLIELYEKYKDSTESPNPNKLLYFNGPRNSGNNVTSMTVSCGTENVETDDSVTCNNGLKFSFAKRYNKTNYDWYDDWYDLQTAGYGQNSLFNEGIETTNGETAYTYCFIYNFSFGGLNSVIKSINTKIKSGTIIWKPSEGSKIGSGELSVQCNMYLPATLSDDYTLENFKSDYSTTWWNVDNYINDLASEIEKIKLKSSETSNTNFDFNFVVDADPYFQKETSWGNEVQVYSHQYMIKFHAEYSKTLKFEKNTGKIISDDNISIDSGYGYPTPMGLKANSTFSPQFTFDFSDTDELKNYFNLKGSSNTYTYSTSCSYTTGDGLTEPHQLNLEFRIIDTKKPFPGINGEGRTTGSNWCERKGNCSYNNALVNNVMSKNNSYNKNGASEPLISISLTPNNIEAISSKYNGYNKDHSYDDFELDCTDGKECTSSFVTKLLNGEFGAVTGSCEKGSYRKYCVGR